MKQMSMFDNSMKQLEKERQARMQDVELLEAVEQIKKEVHNLSHKIKGTSKCSCTDRSMCGYHANIKNRLTETYNKLAYLAKDIARDM